MLLKLPERWKIENRENYLYVSMQTKEDLLPKYEIFIKEDFEFIIRVYAWGLPKEHQIYINNMRSLENITLSQLIQSITKLNLCKGMDNDQFSNEIIKQVIPKTFCPITDNPFLSSKQTIYKRSTDCYLLINTDSTCNACISTSKNVTSKNKKAIKRKAQTILEPAKSKAPISLTSPARILLKMQNQRTEIKSLKADNEYLRKELEKSSVPVSPNLHEDLNHIIKENTEQMTPFMKLFWEEQQKYITTSRSAVRYHPMIIRYCLALSAKSPQAYEDLRHNPKTGTGILVLPSRRRLREYKNYIRPERGFNPHIINELNVKTSKFSDSEKYVVLLFDEVKIQENLVWDKHTGELIGYVDLGDADTNYATLDKVDELATHILVFMIRSIVNPFKFTLANFSTTGATSSQIFPIFWEAVGICELQCNLKVLATTCDGASPNRKFFRMHLGFSDEVNDTDVVYKTKNLFAPGRYIFFISDPPHLIKTARNCLSNSGAGRATRFMWNNGFYILWNHIYEVFLDDRNNHLHLLEKLSYEHMKLSSYSVMSVKLAAQVLSSTVSTVLQNHAPPYAHGTAVFCSMMDKFFDIMNIRNKTETTTKSKPFLKPFDSVNDDRFDWLKNTFLPYFENWLQSIENRPGEYTANAKSNMFISWQTHEGIKITCNSVIELVKYLLNHGVKYVLTERFCQDPLENYFGRQRSLGARNQNMDVRNFGYNDNTIRNQKVFRPIASGNSVDNVALMDISDEPVPCRKRRK